MKDVVEINNLQNLVSERTHFWILGTISVRNMKQKFWYMGCSNWTRHINAEFNETFNCVLYEQQNVQAVPRIRVEVELHDNSASIPVTLFWRKCRDDAILFCSPNHGKHN